MSPERPDKPASSTGPDDEELLARAIPIDSLEGESNPAGQTGPAGQAEQPEGDAEASSARSSAASSEAGGPEQIEFDAGDDTGEQQPSRIRAMEGGGGHRQKPWKRQPNVSGQGATHVRTFVAKLRYEAIEHLDEQINDWLDAHPECEVKFVTTAVGPLTGKLKEDALFVNVWV